MVAVEKGRKTRNYSQVGTVGDTEHNRIQEDCGLHAEREQCDSRIQSETGVNTFNFRSN